MPREVYRLLTFAMRRIRELLTILAFAAITEAAHAAASHAVPDTMAQRAVACTTCHGKEGRAANEGYFPRIAGKPAGYLYNQLVNFRDGRRHYALMTYLVEHLTDAYLHEMAEYFAGLDLPYPPPPQIDAPQSVLSAGESLVRRGDAARSIPACVACHGERLTGVAPASEPMQRRQRPTDLPKVGIGSICRCQWFMAADDTPSAKLTSSGK